MNPEIKTRLAQIRAGEIPQGYKRTHTGIVPQNWEIKKMSSVLKKQTQKNRNNAIQNVLTNSATQGIVCQIDYFDKQIANNENTDEYYVVKPGYFVYNPRISVTAPCGPFNRYNGNEDGIMSPLYSIYCFCDKSKTYSDFLTYYFSSSKWYAYMNSIANYGARSDRMNVTKEDMDNMPIPYPPLYEQQRIVAILSTQDRIIELCERKIEQLKRMKKYYLQKMFPKDGEEYPEIRFKVFTDAWEQREFGELVVIERGGSPRPIDDYITDSPDGLNWVKIGDAPEQGNYITSTKEKIRPEGLSKTREVHPGDLILSNSMSFGKPYIMAIDGCIHDGWLSIKNTKNIFDLKFLCVLLGTDQMLTQYKSMAAGSTVNNLNKELVGNTTVTYPNVEEQRTIGQFFEKIENLITLHQRKCEEEKKKKKALQQLLLMGIVRV